MSASMPNRSLQCALSAEMAARSLDCANKEYSQLIKGSDHSPPASSQWSTSRYCSPSPGRTLINQHEFSKRPPTHLGMKHLTHVRSRGNRAGSAWKQRQLWECKTAVTSPLMKRPSNRGSQAGLSLGRPQWEDQTQKL